MDNTLLRITVSSVFFLVGNYISDSYMAGWISGTIAMISVDIIIALYEEKNNEKTIL